MAIKIAVTTWPRPRSLSAPNADIGATGCSTDHPVCGAGDPSVDWLCDGLEHGDGLHRESIDLRDLVRGQAHEFAPAIPDWGWKLFLRVAFTLLNLRGIKTSARVNAGLTVG